MPFYNSIILFKKYFTFFHNHPYLMRHLLYIRCCNFLIRKVKHSWKAHCLCEHRNYCNGFHFPKQHRLLLVVLWNVPKWLCSCVPISHFYPTSRKAICLKEGSFLPFCIYIYIYIYISNSHKVFLKRRTLWLCSHLLFVTSLT